MYQPLNGSSEVQGATNRTGATETEDVDVIQYSTATGYFLQDEESTNPEGFDFVSHFRPQRRQRSFYQTSANFGLIEREYDSDAEFDPKREKFDWQRFDHHIYTLNTRTPSNVQYKLFYSNTLRLYAKPC